MQCSVLPPTHIRLPEFDISIFGKSSDEVWYPAPPTLQIKIESVISPTFDFEFKVHQLPFAKNEYLKIFVKILFIHARINFRKNFIKKFIKIIQLKTTKNFYLTTRRSKSRASSGRKKSVYYFNLLGTKNLLLKTLINCGRRWFFSSCRGWWRGCGLSTPANFIFVFLW